MAFEVNANIANQAPIFNPADSIQKGLQIANMIQQQKQGRQQFQNQQAQFEQQQAYLPMQHQQEQALNQAKISNETKQGEYYQAHAQDVISQAEKANQTAKTEAAYSQANTGKAFMDSFLGIVNDPNYKTNPVLQQMAADKWSKDINDLVVHGGHTELKDYQTFDPVKTPLLAKQLSDQYDSYISNAKSNYGATTRADTDQKVQEMKGINKLQVASEQGKTAEQIAEMRSKSTAVRQAAGQVAKDSKDWDTFSKEVLISGRGMNQTAQLAQKTLVNANRALDILNKPIRTSQDAATVAGDITQIVTGKAATDFGMQEAQYSTLKNTLGKAVQWVSGHPQEALPDEISQHLKEFCTSLATQNRTLLNDWYSEIEDQRPDLVGPGAPHEAQFQRIRNRALYGSGESDLPPKMSIKPSGQTVDAPPTIKPSFDELWSKYKKNGVK